MITNKRAIIVVNPVSSARLYGDAIRQKGYRSIALITRKCFPSGLQKLHSIDSFDAAIYVENLKDAKEKLRDLNVKAIIPGSDSGIGFTDKLSKHFKVPGNPVETYLSRFNKLEMRKRLNSPAEHTKTAFKLTTEMLDLGIAIDMDFPVVVKPSQGTGARNVRICHSMDDVYKAVSTIEIGDPGGLPHEKTALVEPYISGQEFFIVSANMGPGNLRHAICFAEYEKIQKKNRPSVYKNIRSAPITSETAKKAFSYACQVNSALEVDYGINDIELKINSTGCFVIEQNGRLPGANVPKLIELCTGIDCYDLNIEIYLGQKTAITSPPNQTKHFCVCCLISNEKGTIKKIEGLQFVKELQSFYKLDILVSVGGPVEVTYDFLSAWGFVYLIHQDPTLLREEAESVHDQLRLLLTPS